MAKTSKRFTKREIFAKKIGKFNYADTDSDAFKQPFIANLLILF